MKYPWVSFENGNYTVKLNLLNGTKIRETEDDFLNPTTIESMDIKITNCCDMGCKYCFPPGTQITKADNSKVYIENIKVGDFVKSYNKAIASIEDREVKQIFCRPYNGDLICIEADDGSLLKCTPNHMILTNRGWIAAENLKEFDEIIKF